ncbi:MAG: hypothetical protein BHW55_04820 [Candidatus Melainabacteria bacterium 35_41]|nr:MAG: hypothetical protein BHW55_04820 [Candidatus Melainabacteria bacterium 35_41]
MKKTVIAYLHTHWDREWYREYEVFRLRLLRVFDNVLELLENNKIPSFYFDGQVCALLDYLEIRPEKEALIRQLISEKKLFVGPFYTLVDEFLTDRTVFEKNLEIGLKISKDFGCTDFIGYLADTFGHSKNIPPILKEYGMDKCVVWRGCGDFPSEFTFNGVNTINLVRGYFMDIFSAPMTIEQKAEWLKGNLDKIAEKSGEYLLLPIGADHLGVEKDISEQIQMVNKLLVDYEIKLSTPFEYFELVKDNFKQFEWNDELRDNSKTFILQGSYSARMKVKQYNIKCTYMLEQADKLQKKYGSKYNSVIEYAYKLLLKNQAHDGICGCSTDLVHRENITRYEKILQIANTIIEELRLEHNFKTPVMQSKDLLPEYKVISKHFGVENSLLYDTQKIPVTEDFTTIYTLKKSPAVKPEINFEVKNGKIRIGNVEMQFVRFQDEGDTYNFGAVEDDKGEVAEVYSFKNNIIKTSFFDVQVDIGELINFKIEWDNKLKNKIWQVKFNLKQPVTETYSEDMNSIIKREFNPEYDMRKHLPKERGIEVKTNFAPMQRYVGAQGFGIITQGLTEYEIKEKSILITLLRSTDVISNPKNPSRSTPAGPPIEVPDAQQPGYNCAEFSAGFFEAKDYQKYIDIVYPPMS